MRVSYCVIHRAIRIPERSNLSPVLLSARSHPHRFVRLSYGRCTFSAHTAAVGTRMTAHSRSELQSKILEEREPRLPVRFWNSDSHRVTNEEAALVIKISSNPVLRASRKVVFS